MAIYRNRLKVLILQHLKMICLSSESALIIISKLIWSWWIVTLIWTMKPQVEFLTNLNFQTPLSLNGIWFVKIIGLTLFSLRSSCPGYFSVSWSLVHLLISLGVSILWKSLLFSWSFLNLELRLYQNPGQCGLMQFSVCLLAVLLSVEVPLDSFTLWRSSEPSGEHGLVLILKCFSVLGTSACLLLVLSAMVKPKHIYKNPKLFSDWRLMMIVFSAMPIFYVLIFFFLLPKSARFLFSAGRNEEAKKALLKIGKRFPKRNINEEFAKQVEYSTMECFQKV